MKSNIHYDVFASMDIIVGEIMNAQPVEGSEKLLELTIDLGQEYGTVTIMSGIARWYSPEELIGKKTPVLANLAPRTMMGKESQGMVLAWVTAQDEAKLIYLEPELANGTRLC